MKDLNEALETLANGINMFDVLNNILAESKKQTAEQEKQTAILEKMAANTEISKKVQLVIESEENIPELSKEEKDGNTSEKKSTDDKNEAPAENKEKETKKTEKTTQKKKKTKFNMDRQYTIDEMRRIASIVLNEMDKHDRHDFELDVTEAFKKDQEENITKDNIEVQEEKYFEMLVDKMVDHLSNTDFKGLVILEEPEEDLETETTVTETAVIEEVTEKEEVVVIEDKPELEEVIEENNEKEDENEEESKDEAQPPVDFNMDNPFIANLIYKNKKDFSKTLLADDEFMQAVNDAIITILPNGASSLMKVYGDVKLRGIYDTNLAINAHKSKKVSNLKEAAIIEGFATSFYKPLVYKFAELTDPLRDANKNEVETQPANKKEAAAGRDELSKIQEKNDFEGVEFVGLTKEEESFAKEAILQRGVSENGNITMGNGTFELLKDDTIKINNETLYRIKYLKDVTYTFRGADHVIAAGKSTGFVSEKALIKENVILWPDAKIPGYAMVAEKSLISNQIIIPAFQRMLESMPYGNVKALEGSKADMYEIKNFKLSA